MSGLDLSINGNGWVPFFISLQSHKTSNCESVRFIFKWFFSATNMSFLTHSYVEFASKNNIVQRITVHFNYFVKLSVQLNELCHEILDAKYVQLFLPVIYTHMTVNYFESKFYYFQHSGFDTRYRILFTTNATNLIKMLCVHGNRYVECSLVEAWQSSTRVLFSCSTFGITHSDVSKS